MNEVRIKRGLKADLPTHLPLGEPAFCIDTGELFIGMGSNEPLKPIVDGDLISRVANKFDDVTTEQVEGEGTYVRFIANGVIVKEILVEGGGSGGISAPNITSNYPEVSSKPSDTSFRIDYTFISPNRGEGVATYTLENASNEVTQVGEPVKIKQGKNYVDVPALAKGSYKFTISVVDFAGQTAYPLTFTINVGSLELISHFNEEEIQTISKAVNINFDVDSVNNEPITLIRTCTGNNVNINEEVSITKGNHDWNLGTLAKGTYAVTLQAKSGDEVSNKIVHNIAVVDSESLYVTLVEPEEVIEFGKSLRVSYRISMQNEKKFNVYTFIDEQEQPLSKGTLGINFWDINDLEIGYHDLKIVATTINPSNPENVKISNVCTFRVNVVSIDYTPVEAVTRGLVAHFDAKTKANSQSNRNVWNSRVGDYKIDLYQFNYTANGWLEEKLPDSEQVYKYLKCNGETYGVLNYAPLSDNAQTGFTFDIVYRTRNVGNLDARVISCENSKAPYNGFYITPQDSYISSYVQNLSTTFSEDSWVRVTYTIDRTNKRLVSYVNGVITKFTPLQDYGSLENFSHNDKLYINCRLNPKTQKLEGFGNCEIKSIRIYNRALNHEEVVQNMIADIDVMDEQKAYNEYVNSLNLPKMYFEGDAYEDMTKETKVTLRIKYDPPASGEYGKPFDLPLCQVNWQGTSTLAYAVKNYKIRLRDEQNKKYKYAPISHWKEESTFTLKADYMESSHMNNTGTAKIVNQLCKTPIPPQVDDPDIRTAIDGFPILLYIKGRNDQTFRLAGVYMFNIDKGASNCFGFDKDNPNCLSYEVSANSDVGAGAFNDYTMSAIHNDFEVRFPESREGDTEHPELQRLVRWVKEATDEQFKTEIHQYLNLEYTIAYYVQVFTFAMVDNLGKNMMLNTWDGRVWYPTFYDMDTMLGLDNTGYSRIPAHADLNTIIENAEGTNSEKVFNTSDSQLWTKLRRCFWNEIKEHYAKMRETIYNWDYLKTIYNDEIAYKIGPKNYNFDMEAKYFPYGNQYSHMCNGDRLEFVKRFISERLLYVDTVFGYEKDTKETITFRCNKQGETTFRIKTYSPQWVTVRFRNSSISSDGGAEGGGGVETETEVRKLVSNDKFTEFTGRVNTDRDQEIIVTNAKHIMEIQGLEKINVSFVKVSTAEKLTSLNVSNSKRLTSLEIGNNRMLQTLQATNCPNLGDEVQILDLRSCENLKTVDISSDEDTEGCKITQLKFSSSGGSLKSINAYKSSLTEFEVENQEFLNEINLSKCSKLVSFKVNNCNAIEQISMQNTIVRDFNIIDCNGLTELNISNNTQVETLGFGGCPNLKVLKMSGVSSRYITDLDLSESQKIEELDISGCAYLQHITFPENYRGLKKLNAKNSVLKAIKFGKYAVMPEELDLGNFELTYLSFYNCPSVTVINNINYTGSSPESPFYNCTNLKTITGTITIKGTMDKTFYNCEKLTNLPTLNLSGVTSGSNTFENCKALTLNNVKQIMSSLGTSFTSQHRFFFKCSGIEGQLPSDLFNNTPNLRTLSEMFRRCSGITSFEDDILAPLGTRLTDLYHAFSETSMSRNVPATLFSRNPNIVSVDGLFYHCNMTGQLPTNLFANLSNLQNVTNMFNSNVRLSTTIPEDLFKNNPELRDAKHTFAYCYNSAESTGVFGTIPENLFQNCPKLRSCTEFVRGCQRIVGNIPENLFANTPELQNIDGLFYDCKNLTGSIPPRFLANNNLLLTANSLFRNCNKLTGVIPPDLLRGKSSLTNISYMFGGCSGIVSTIPKDLLADCVAIVNISGLFSECSSLYGEIPVELFSHTSTIIECAYVFNYCTNLISEIPEDLFKNCTQVSNMKGIFKDCRKIYGKIPDRLFANCFSLTDLTDAFFKCYELGDRHIDPVLNPYCVSPDLFKNCGLLKKTYRTFYECLYLKGDIPEGLFRNNANITDFYEMFYGCSGLTGDLDAELFANQLNAERVTGMFEGCNKLTSIHSDLFSKNKKITSFERVFKNCSSLKGYSIPLWESHPSANGSSCYNNCTSLTDYNTIPSTWK